MGRRKSGRPVDGWVLIDKPQGVTSTAVVAKVRWAFRAQKAGHAGTLDPLATGLLAVALGEATKTVSVAQEGLKTYRFTVRFGASTDTDDAEGEVLERRDSRPTEAEIDAALPALVGEIMQVPPRYSAVKVAGERAYDLAREGEVPELAARPLFVESLELLARPDPDHAELEMVCGKGGYVRAVARDLGEALGCLGHVVALRRLASGAFHVNAAIGFEALDEIRASGDPGEALLPVAAGLAELPSVRVGAAEAAQLRQGRPVPVAGADLEYGDRIWAQMNGEPVAICRYAAGMAQPERVIHAPPAPRCQ